MDNSNPVLEPLKEAERTIRILERAAAIVTRTRAATAPMLMVEMGLDEGLAEAMLTMLWALGHVLMSDDGDIFLPAYPAPCRLHSSETPLPNTEPPAA